MLIRLCLLFALCVGQQQLRGASPELSEEDAAFVDDLQKRTFGYFWELTPSANGLTPDRGSSRFFL
ncbi:MAG: hypothetical protein ACI8T1_005151 [Verrucomicrobiales bacterium]|jgi:hypothetical protein